MKIEIQDMKEGNWYTVEYKHKGNVYEAYGVYEGIEKKKVQLFSQNWARDFWQIPIHKIIKVNYR